MSGRTAKGEPTPTSGQIIAALRADLIALRQKNASKRIIQAHEEALWVYSAKGYPHFWQRLYLEYASSPEFPKRMAAIGAMYCFFASKDRHPIEATVEGFDLNLDADENGMTKVPAWIVVELISTIQDYLNGDYETLHDAMQFPKGSWGTGMLKRPAEDFGRFEALVINKLRRFQDQQTVSDGGAAKDIAEFAAGLTGGDDTRGYGERSTLDAIRKIRRVLNKLGFRRK